MKEWLKGQNFFKKQPKESQKESKNPVENLNQKNENKEQNNEILQKSIEQKDLKITENFKGPEFLKNKFWTFKDFRDIVEKSVRRAKNKGEIPQKPIEQIPIYIARLIKILEKQKGKELILQKLFQKYVIKKENINSEVVKNLLLGSLAEQMGYTRDDLKNENVKKLVLEEFRRKYHENFEDYQVPQDILENQRKVIIEEQKNSLALWFNYLTSSEAQNYPPEFRYWVFSEVLKLGAYNEKDKSFTKRTEKTTAPFAPLNLQALSIILDELLRKYENKPSKILPNLSEEEKEDYIRRLQIENFSKLYGWALAYIKNLILPKERLPIITGEWQEFQNPEESEKLVSQIKDFPTGWCIAGEATAKGYLSHSKIFIYFSQDAQNNNTIPRAAIVINKARGDITEIRGIESGQKLDPYIIPVVEKKLKEIPGSSKYLFEINLRKKLVDIYFKHSNGLELDKDELKFLYNYDKNDPIVEEILKNRDRRKDYAIIYDCPMILNYPEDHIAFSPEELNDETEIYIGDFRDLRIPYNLKYIKGDAYFLSYQYPHNLEVIDGNAYFGLHAQIGNLKKITKNANFKKYSGYSLENLEEIGGNANFSYSDISDINSLRKIGGNADFSYSKIESFKNLEEIVGDADFRYSQIGYLNSLRKIGGNAYFYYSKIEGLKNLEEIGGNADFRGSNIRHLPKLKKIGGEAIVYSYQKHLIRDLKQKKIKIRIEEYY